jgi:hypothetical protein
MAAGRCQRIRGPSRDGGVDCVAWDNRPILGGKVIIQAKREWAGAAFFTFERGLVSDLWVLGDLRALYQQLAASHD